MGGIRLSKENIKGILDEFRKTYGDIKLSDLSNKIWEDDELKEIIISHKLLTGKRVSFINKNGNLLKYNVFRGKKI